MAYYQLPLVVNYQAEEERVPLPIKIALGERLVEIIGAGTKVPVKRVVEISNAEENQKSLTIRVFQGASNRIEANAPVGTYVISRLPAAAVGALSIDLSLEVTPSLGFNLRASSGDFVYDIELLIPGKPLGLKAIAALMEEEQRDELPAFDGVYDRADYHTKTIAEEGLPPKQAFVHTGMFVGWLIETCLLSENFSKRVQDDTEAFSKRLASGPELYERWQGALQDDMLGSEGSAFARAYFDLDRGHYLEDYAEVLAPEEETLFAVEDTWVNYDLLAKRLNLRFAEWQSKRAEPSIKWERVRERPAKTTDS